jgi:organic radical activating enzyme
LLQVDAALTEALHQQGFTIAVETNGTQAAPPGIDWLCVSPKGQAPLVLTGGQELKLVHPQPGVDPSQFEHLDFDHFYLQPQDPICGDALQAQHNTQACIDYCRTHPQWRLSLQTHKWLGIP